MEVIRPFTVGEAAEILSAADEILHVSDKEIVQTLSLRELLTAMLQMEGLQQLWSQTPFAGLREHCRHHSGRHA